MRPGPARGTTIQRELVVDATMVDAADAVDGAALPPTFGLLAMADVITKVARDLLVEHLEEGEILVPSQMEIIRRSPVPVGTSVLLEATVQMVAPTRVSIEVLIRTPVGVAARGSCEQEVVSRSAWLSLIGVSTV